MLHKRTDELIQKFIEDELSSPEEQELEAKLTDSRYAREEYERARAFKAERPKGEADPDEKPIVVPKTSLGMRIGAALLLAVIAFGFLGMFWIELFDDLAQVKEGSLLSSSAEAVRIVSEPGEFSVAADGDGAVIKLKGDALVGLRQGSKFRVDQEGPAAKLTLLKGALSLERSERSRECILMLDGAKVFPLPGTKTLGLDPVKLRAEGLESGGFEMRLPPTDTLGVRVVDLDGTRRLVISRRKATETGKLTLWLSPKGAILIHLDQTQVQLHFPPDHEITEGATRLITSDGIWRVTQTGFQVAEGFEVPEAVMPQYAASYE